ncbi:PIR Superfamily Protein [Plasmodium ovale wallikeri]|uniref:PIR Superfamily Protein n=1 Tax=Plasmodium ovale wallikeri TaxID=864142 RepID=A0A1A9ALK0_PLAOA|nr:PIR Superfamily Protein [Plasmodium ovale wallikeri]SBT59090.1 PIR Superfamily Protein [Plasmodium ovale wallikeri]
MKSEVLLEDADKYKKYNEFNTVHIPDDYEDSFSEALYAVSYDSKIKNLCGKLAGSLEIISQSKVITGYDTSEQCGYLHFWLYYELSKIFRDNNEQTNTQVTIRNIFTGWSDFNKKISNYTCSARFSDGVSMDKWIKGKLLHDYFKNFDYISNAQAFKDKKCEAYNKYINHINTLYKNFKDKSYFSYNIYRYLRSYTSDKYDPAKLISKLECKNDKPTTDSLPHESAPFGVKIEQADSATELQREDTQSGISSTDSNSSSIVGSSVSLIGMFILFFSAYRFTPLGPWIYGKILKSEKIQNNIDNVTNALLDNNSEYMDINPNSSSFHVAYNPT